MRKVILYIAMSLDGYIADSTGSVDWLNGQDSAGEDEDTYADLMKAVDTVVMGWNTYHQITTELSPDQWVYSMLTSYVITHRALPSTENIRFVQEEPCSVVRRLRQEPGRGIWICGGAGIIQPLVRAGMIDEFHIAIMPTILGSGLRLWEEIGEEIRLQWMRAQSYNGITELVYTRR